MAADRYQNMLRMPQELADEVKAYADRRGISFNSAVCILVRERLDEDNFSRQERGLVLAKS